MNTLHEKEPVKICLRYCNILNNADQIWRVLNTNVKQPVWRNQCSESPGAPVIAFANAKSIYQPQEKLNGSEDLEIICFFIAKPDFFFPPAI